MRPRMSDLDKRERWLDYLSTHHTATIEETGVTPEDWVLNTAWGEARSILADAEPRQEQGMSGHWPCGRPNMAWQAERFCYDESGYLSGTGWMAHAALVESLRAFVA